MKNRRAISEMGIGMICVIIILGMFILALIGWVTSATASYDVTVKVMNVERSDRLFPHTYVWCEQYVTGEGREALKYEFYGHHELIPGHIYRIKWHNEIGMHPLNWLFYMGRIESITLIE